jgi:hypothetical protein
MNSFLSAGKRFAAALHIQGLAAIREARIAIHVAKQEGAYKLADAQAKSGARKRFAQAKLTEWIVALSFEIVL